MRHNMKLPRITKPQKQERLSLSVPDTLVAQMDAYAQYYGAHYGQEVTRQDIARHILEVFIDSDKDFKRWMGNFAAGTGKQTNKDVA